MKQRFRLVQQDSYLEKYENAIQGRYDRFQSILSGLEAEGGLLGPVSQGHNYFGFHIGEKEGRKGIWYREWAPGARELSLTGDFNDWNRHSHPLTREMHGNWTLFIPDADGRNPLIHRSLVKVHIVSDRGAEDRIPTYIRRVVQDPENHHFTAQVWLPPHPYQFQHETPQLTQGLRIYEAHVGIATEEYKVGSFVEFTEKIIPRVKSLGYNAIQLMAIMEHPLYASFGYHISSFFAVSSRFGEPEDLKRLIDTAHSQGQLVLMDLVHSHAVKNTQEGLLSFDGTAYQYFHEGARGYHPQWDSMLFNYAKPEVQHFLLSNIRFWQEEYHFDGFRLDGVTSMIYKDHGINHAFTSYEDYFDGNVDPDALLYLQLANQLTHTLNPRAITIAEEVSGLPGIARPIEEGGIGFDYRLNMGVPDFWIKIVKSLSDEQWSLAEIYQTLLYRRHTEKHVGYAESHDQALVGDQALLFRLIGEDMYWHMNLGSQSYIVDRGIALIKMIKLITFSLGGEAYLNFMGNEFGHPEWIDFPREGNNHSYHYARRLWSLAENDQLRYAGLGRFDRAMLHLDSLYNLLLDPFIEQLALHEDTKQLVYRRGPLVFAFNFHPVESYSGLRIPVPDPEDYMVILNSDDVKFGGFGRCGEERIIYPIQKVDMYGREQSVQIYLPARSVQALVPVSRLQHDSLERH